MLGTAITTQIKAYIHSRTRRTHALPIHNKWCPEFGFTCSTGAYHLLLVDLDYGGGGILKGPGAVMAAISAFDMWELPWVL